MRSNEIEMAMLPFPLSEYAAVSAQLRLML